MTMPLAWLFIVALLLLALAAFAHLQIPRYTAGSGNTILSRAVLAITGTGLGFATAMVYPGDPSRTLLAFLIGFGIVHFPAAVILLIKRARHSGKF